MSTYALRTEQTLAPPPSATAGDVEFQRRILPGVSRTFALTIPELPERLHRVVENGYLLCRIADTIEDDPGLELAEKARLHRRFAAAVRGEDDAQALAADLAPRLTGATLEAERELAAQADAVVRVTQSFEPAERAALARCVSVMCEGMPRFQTGGDGALIGRAHRGLDHLAEFHDYCYTVAGVVGEMLTELFCASSPAIAAHRAELEQRAVAFGQALQMTNILKDVWDDLERGFCWLPREVFARHGFDLDALPGLADGERSAAFEAGLGELLAVAHGHLRSALEYTLLVPRAERGVRRFCLWALGMAVLTVRKIDRHRGYRTSREVKISRRAVRATVLASNVALRSNLALRLMFALATRGLPRPLGAAGARP